MFKIKQGDNWIEIDKPATNQLCRKYDDYGGHKEYNFTETSPEDIKSYQETQWQESELLITDEMLQPDRPNAQAIIDYRIALRAYNNAAEFPNGVRPTL